MMSSAWIFYYMHPVTEEEQKAIEELRSIKGQEVQVVYLYNGN